MTKKMVIDLLKIMGLKKKHFTENELKNLMTEVKTRDITDEESEILWEMYYQRWGRASFGRCLHPYWLLEDMKQEKLKESSANEEAESENGQIKISLKSLTGSKERFQILR